MTRYLGIVNIEVKSVGNPVTYENFAETYNNQSTRNRGAIQDTVANILKCLDPNMTQVEVERIVKSFVSGLPGFVAVPNLSKESVNGFPMARFQHFLFKEDFESDNALCDFLVGKMYNVRDRKPVQWDKKQQDAVIAGLFCISYMPMFLMPLKPREASKCLYNLTCEQAKIFTDNFNAPTLKVAGPAGTGKTWLMMMSVKKKFEQLINQPESKKILIITFNRPILDSIKTNITSLIQAENVGVEADRCEILYFTMDALLLKLKEDYKRIIGNKATKKDMALVLSATTFIEDYLEDLSIPPLDGLFMDEGQDIGFEHEKWLRKLLRSSRKTFWVFGDPDQNVRIEHTSGKSILMPNGELEPTTHRLHLQLRNTKNIFEYYHDYAFGDKEPHEENLRGSHCTLCLVKPARIEGPWVTESKVDEEDLKDRLYEAITEIRQNGTKNTAILCDNNELAEELRNNLQDEGIETLTANEWAVGGPETPKPCLDSVRRFKGLEAQNVFLILRRRIGSQLISIEDEKELVYCGMSRAISKLVVFHIYPETSPLHCNVMHIFTF